MCLTATVESEIVKSKVYIYKHINISSKFSKDLYQCIFPKTVYEKGLLTTC